MSYQALLITEIDNVLNSLDSYNENWNIKCVVAEICQNYEPELVGDALFSRYNIYTNMRKEVRERMNKKMQDNKAEVITPQLTLFGREFQHLQPRYLIIRDGEAIAVPIQKMTNTELEEKAKFHDKLSVSSHEHAIEIREYISLRDFNNR